LINYAFEENWIDEREHEGLIKANKARNSVLHFRKPLSEKSLEVRSLDEDKLTYLFIEEDSKHVLIALFNILKRYSIQ